MVWVQVHGGSIVPLQQPAMTTGEVRHSPLTLVVALQQEVINASCTVPVSVCSVTDVRYTNIITWLCKHPPLTQVGVQAKACS